MKTVEASCKICGKKLSLEIADAYDRDPMKLVPLATCNRCGDIRESRRGLERAIVNKCYTLAIQKQIKSEAKGAIQKALTVLTQSYAKTIADEFNCATGLWDEEFVLMLMEQPEKAGIILSKYRQDCRVNSVKVQPQSKVSSLPYAD